MKKNKQIYDNITPLSMRDEGPGSGKRCGYCLVIVSVLLFLSLMANAFMAYFYFKNKHVTVSSPEQIRRCSAEERQIQYKDRLYIFPKDEMSWISSRESCHELGGDLVTINSREEHNFLVGAMNSFGSSLHWIGLRHVEWEARWQWVDETPLMQNRSWWKSMPEAGTSEKEGCVGYYDRQWVDLSCLSSERRICEIICTH